MLDVKTQASPARAKSKKKVAAIIAVILIVSVVLIVFGSIVLHPVIEDLAGSAGISGPANGGLADPMVKRDVWGSIVVFEKGNGCDDPVSTLISITQQPDTNGAWVEQWDVNACSEEHSYKVHFSPSLESGNVVYSITK